MKLYSYYRSSASYRVRIALELKGLAYTYMAVNLAQGAQHGPDFQTIAPAGMVPLLEVNGLRLTQSMAIMEYLEDTHPKPPLLPADPLARAQVRALAQMIACDLHPLNNLRVLRYLQGPLHHSDDAKTQWYEHWTRTGLETFERQLQVINAHRTAQGHAPSTYCVGQTPTLADCVLVPQIYNALRFGVPLHDLPLTVRAYEACQQLEAFTRAAPANCPDAVQGA